MANGIGKRRRKKEEIANKEQAFLSSQEEKEGLEPGALNLKENKKRKRQLLTQFREGGGLKPVPKIKPRKGVETKTKDMPLSPPRKDPFESDDIEIYSDKSGGPISATSQKSLDDLKSKYVKKYGKSEGTKKYDKHVAPNLKQFEASSKSYKDWKKGGYLASDQDLASDVAGEKRTDDTDFFGNPKKTAESNTLANIQNQANSNKTRTDSEAINIATNNSNNLIPTEEEVSNEINKKDNIIVEQANKIEKTADRQLREGGATGYVPPGTTITNIANKDKDEKEDPDLTKEMDNKDLFNMVNNSSGVAIDALKSTQYFPQGSRSIGVGTFTGSRIGSQTIYSGAGVLAPLGILDARKMAFQKKAQAQMNSLTKLKESIGHASSQFDQNFQGIVSDNFEDIYKKHNGDVSKILTDQSFRSNVRALKAFAKGSQDISKKAYEAIERATPGKDGKVLQAMSKEDLDALTEYLTDAQDPDYINKVLSGKINQAEVINNVLGRFKLTDWIDDTWSNMTADKMRTEVPFNFEMREGLKSEEELGDMYDFLKKVQSDPNLTTDQYVTGIKKYFSFGNEENIRKMVESKAQDNNIFRGSKDYDGIIQRATDYYLSKIPKESITLNWSDKTNMNKDKYIEYYKNKRFKDKLKYNKWIQSQQYVSYANSEGALKGSNPLEVVKDGKVVTVPGTSVVSVRGKDVKFNENSFYISGTLSVPGKEDKPFKRKRVSELIKELKKNEGKEYSFKDSRTGKIIGGAELGFLKDIGTEKTFVASELISNVIGKKEDRNVESYVSGTVKIKTGKKFEKSTTYTGGHLDIGYDQSEDAKTRDIGITIYGKPNRTMNNGERVPEATATTDAFYEIKTATIKGGYMKLDDE